MIAVFLVYFLIRRGSVNESQGVGGALDRAIAVNGDVLAGDPGKAGSKTMGYGPSIVGVIMSPRCRCSSTLLGHPGRPRRRLRNRAPLLHPGGREGGMVWLCMVTFAGVGAVTAAQLATNHGWPVLLAVVAGGMVALPMGVIIGLLTIRLGDLYVALVTLTFGLLMENLVFSRNLFLHHGLGVNLNSRFATPTKRSPTWPWWCSASSVCSSSTCAVPLLAWP